MKVINNEYESSQPTYEELKHKCLYKRGRKKYCSQPTYEELKHIEVSKMALDNFVFPAYLWGIETLPRLLLPYKNQ